MPNNRLAYTLLTLTALFWAGNFVLARAVHASVPPIGLAFWRWFAVAVFVVPWGWGELRRQWPLMRARPALMLALGVCSVGAFNTLIYIGLQTTSAVNALLLISAAPVLILALAPLLLGNKLVARQALGVAVSATGVLLVLTHGDIAAIASLGQHVGSLWVLAGVLSWALYSVLLRKLPPVINGRGLFAATVIVGLIALLPFYLGETFIQHRPVQLNTTLLLTVAYVAVFASVLAYLFWNRAVTMIGAEQSGVFIHLMPAFGLILSALLLGERITAADLIGLALILSGLIIAAGRLIPTRRRAP
ncbi:DMT family transporter [Acidihalobacter ferrooxydans]|nr:DMT family transporter [Acidihalobacter ferrooxydans]